MSRRALLALVAALAALAALAVLALVALRAARSAAPAATLARPAFPPAASAPAPSTASTPVPSAAPTAPTPVLPPRASGPPSVATVRAALAVLDRARAAAYADPPDADPTAWALPTCACHAEDARRLRDLARSGLALRGHAVTLTAVTLLPARAGPALRVEALVTDRVGAYTAVDPAGRVVRRWPATPSRRWRVTLVRTTGRWRYAAVARAP
jgi:hypothetical protein